MSSLSPDQFPRLGKSTPLRALTCKPTLCELLRWAAASQNQPQPCICDLHEKQFLDQDVRVLVALLETGLYAVVTAQLLFEREKEGQPNG